MKIIIGDLNIDVVSLSVTDSELVIQTLDTINPYEVMPLIGIQDTLVCVDDGGNISQTFEGDFSSHCIVLKDGYVFYHIPLPSPLEKAEKRIKELSDALTNIELALCEIYESMEV
jgi:hypothetical protein